MSGNTDLLFLRAAVALAKRGLYTCAPNPRVGCLIVRDGRTLGRGWHVQLGAHSRFTADVQGILDGTTADHGWIVRKVLDGKAGKVEYTSREGLATRPQLIVRTF